MSVSVCHVCGSDGLEVVFETPLMPIAPHRRWACRAEAVRAVRDTIELRWCATCGALVNAKFDPAKVVYDGAYENALSHSPGQRAYLAELAQELAVLPGVPGGSAMEIGSGDGALLSALVEQGLASSLGIDPAARASTNPKVRVLRRHAVATDAIGADLVILRHVLEHIHNPVPWLAAMVARLRAGARVYVEVPSGDRMLEHLGIWDLLYEHVTTLTSRAFAGVLGRCGLSGEPTERFGGQYLGAIAHATSAMARSAGEPTDREASLVRSFARDAPSAIEQWSERVRGMNGPVAVWGAGTKGVAFLNFVDPLAESIELAVDTNVRKQGGYVAGTGHAISGPDALADLTPATVVLLNPMYEAEVRAALAGRGLEPELVMA